MCWFRRRKGGQFVMGPQQPRPQVQKRIPKAPPVATITTIEGKRHYNPDIIIHTREGAITGRLPFKLTAEEAREVIDQLTRRK